MRIWLLAVVVAFGCKGKDKEQEAAVKAALVIPKVEVATVIAKDSPRMPFLIVIDDKGARAAAAESWAALDLNEVKIAKRSMDLDHLDRYIREDFAMGKTPVDTVTAMNEYADSDDQGVEIDLAVLEDTTRRNNSLTEDDPPPPEEEDKPDDGEDESGGTGTAMALDEGRMGKKDSDRAEGQYRMQKNQDDPQLVRQQAIEKARMATMLAPPDGAFASLTNQPNEDGVPTRLVGVQGAVMEDGKLDPLRTMILIAPTAKATQLIKTIGLTDGAIAVSHGGKIRPLRLQFMRKDGRKRTNYWLEARVSANGIVVEAVPDKAIEVADLKQLAAALDKARKERGAEPEAPVDVLVDPAIDVQRLIDVIVALDTAGVRTIGLGEAPTGDELTRRGKRHPSLALGQPNAQGDLDKAIIRRYVKKDRDKLRDCYTKALVANSELEGTVMTQFFITPNGSVAQSTASGVDPEVSSCVAGVIKKIEFPKPRGGGGVQVAYPLIFRN
jgi:hypothetical protein